MISLDLRSLTGAALASLLVLPALAGPSDDVPGSDLTPAQVSAELDALLAEAWEKKGVEPRPAATDGEFLRRTSLAVKGRIPSEAEARAFLAADDPAKRAALVRQQVRAPEFARNLASRWAELMVGRAYLLRTFRPKPPKPGQSDQYGMAALADEELREGLVEDPAPPLVMWIERQLADDVPFDAVVRQMLTAEGSLVDNPAGHYLVRYATKGGGAAPELAGHSMRVLQGLQIQCAQCHDHPSADWTQGDFWGVAAFFARLRANQPKMKPLEGSKEAKKKKPIKGPYIVSERQTNNQLRIPVAKGTTGPLALPRWTRVISPTSKAIHRRQALAEQVTAGDNPWFALAIANRVWSFYFGRGVVEPVDDLDGWEGAPLAPVLERLARDFRESGYDMRRLGEVILQTKAFGLSSDGPAATRERELALLARASLRPLDAEEYFYSILEATAVEELADPRARRRLESQKTRLLAKFLRIFGGEDEQTEAEDTGTIPQALEFLNGNFLAEATKPRPGHPVYDRLFRTADVSERVEILYLRTLGRMPTPREQEKVQGFLADKKTAGEQAQAYADLMWALMNTPEFALHH